MIEEQKDYSSISPSAKSLLLMKGYTDIPYARETAALMQGPEIFDLNFDDKDFWFWIRVMHFELRYWSIDQLLREEQSKNILELSSGYSFRGLDLCSKMADIHYIDTDLPELIATKRAMIKSLKAEANLKGQFELLPLNALDENAFQAVVQRFEPGPTSIVNEGLLMYLDTSEKELLCKLIHGILRERGGSWITADVYVKPSNEMRAAMPQSDSERSFLERHQVDENKFDSYDAAEAFFNAQGFEVVKESVPNYERLSILPQLLKVLPEEARRGDQKPPKIQATWKLRAI